LTDCNKLIVTTVSTVIAAGRLHLNLLICLLCNTKW